MIMVEARGQRACFQKGKAALRGAMIDLGCLDRSDGEPGRAGWGDCKATIPKTARMSRINCGRRRSLDYGRRRRRLLTIFK